MAGTIGDAALPAPNSLIIVAGRTPAQLARTLDSVQVTSIATSVPGSPAPRRRTPAPRASYLLPNGGAPESASDVILAVVALAILAPVLIFIATATRLSAARREQRFAAMRLAARPASRSPCWPPPRPPRPRVLGVAAGFGIFFLLRGPVAGIPFIGQPFFPATCRSARSTSSWSRSACRWPPRVAARLALRRVHISPLGVAAGRRRSRRAPGGWYRS